MLRAQYPDDAERIMQAFCERQALRLRVNNLKADAAELASRLDAVADGNMLTVLENQETEDEE